MKEVYNEELKNKYPNNNDDDFIDELNDISNKIKEYMNDQDDILKKKLQPNSNKQKDHKEIKQNY